MLHIRNLGQSSQHPSKKHIIIVPRLQVRKLRLKDNVRFTVATQLGSGAAGRRPSKLCHCLEKGSEERERPPLVPFKDRTLILCMLEGRKQKRP